MSINKEEIKKIIPHREPFLLIDEITENIPGKKVRAIKYVNQKEYYFAGHFPQEKIMPGVLIIEAMAQAGAYCVLSMPENKGKLAYFGGIKNAKFRGKVLPGDKLELEVSLTSFRRNIGYGICQATKNNKVVCRAEISFALGG